MAERAVNFVLGVKRKTSQKVKKVLAAYKTREQYKDIVLEILVDFNLKNSELSDILGIESRATVTKWISGGAVSRSNLVKISDAFPSISLQRLILATAEPEVWIRLKSEEFGLSKIEQKEVMEELGFSVFEPTFQPEGYKKSLQIHANKKL